MIALILLLILLEFAGIPIGTFIFMWITAFIVLIFNGIVDSIRSIFSIFLPAKHN